MTSSQQRQQENKPRNAHGWENPVLTPISLHFPLGPCRTTFKLSQLKEILEKLPEIFRLLSITAKYQNSPITAICSSLEHVGFIITILGSRKKHNDTVVLEIQRKSGSTITFHRLARKILSAVSSFKDIYENLKMNNSLRKLKVPKGRLLDSTSMLPEDSNGSDGATANTMESAWNMLSKDRYDARRLGLESLLCLTDPSKSGFSVAKEATCYILKPNNSIHENISTSLVKYACYKYENSKTTNSIQLSLDSQLSRLSLMILSQVFQMAVQSHNDDMVARFVSSQVSVDLWEFLFRKVLQAPKEPHDAYWAVQCLKSLCRSIPQLRNKVKSNYIEHVHQCGSLPHVALANASNELLIALQA